MFFILIKEAFEGQVLVVCFVCWFTFTYTSLIHILIGNYNFLFPQIKCLFPFSYTSVSLRGSLKKSDYKSCTYPLVAL